MKRIRSLSAVQTFFWCAILLAVFALGWFTSRIEAQSEATRNTAQPVRYKDPEYPLISPLVSVAIPNATGFSELATVKSEVGHIIDTAKQKGSVSKVSVYFRLPVNAHWFGINENDAFDPGSLIKVPIMLAYLKQAEHEPHILDMQFHYSAKTLNSLPNALPPQLPSGTYSASKLLEAMIVESDNIAKDILADHVSEKALQDVFDETNSNFLQDPSGTISPKQYVIMLSRIYNATYLTRYYSNYGMDLLSRTTFKDGLVAGLPANVKVAHKYGERGVYEDNALVGVELHDCGLVYSESPYYLCVMTKGTDESALASTIQAVSAAVYSYHTRFTPTP